MSNYRITRFNTIVGNKPEMGTDFEYWNQIKRQARLVLEEAQELYDAAQEENLVEVLDGFCDVRYTNEYMEDILQAGCVETNRAWDEVCNNNDQKFTQSWSLATESRDLLEDQGIPCYIDEVVYEGELYYTVRRNKDTKVMKLLNHQKPDLFKYIKNV